MYYHQMEAQWKLFLGEQHVTGDIKAALEEAERRREKQAAESAR